MMHLWGKVYLDFDFRVRTDKNRFVVSREFGFPLDQSLASAGGLLHGFGKTLDDLIGSGKQFPTLVAFFEHVQKIQVDVAEPVIIFADRAAYLQVATRWLSSILPAASLQTISEILDLHFHKELTVAGIGGVNQTNDRSKIWYDKAVDQELITLFYNLPETPDFQAFFEKVKGALSIELLLPNFRAGGSHHNATFFKTLCNFLTRWLRDEIYDWRRYAQLNIQNPKVMSILEVPEGVFDLELVPKARPLTNPRFWNVNGNFFARSSNPALLLAEMTEEDISEMQALIHSLRRDYSAEMGAVIQEAEELIIDLLPILAKGSLVKSEAEQIINDERFSARSLWSGDDINKVNFFLIDKLLKRSPAELQEFILR